MSATADAARASGRARGAYLIGSRGYPLLLGLLVATLVLSFLVAVSVGSVSLPLGTVWNAVLDHVLWWRDVDAVERLTDAIIWKFRVPRALLAIVVGAGLAVAGTVLQAIVRNALADPYVMGVAQGGSFGAVLVIALGVAAESRWALSIGAFAGAMVSLLMVVVLGRRSGRVSPTRLVLSGVAIGYLFDSATSFLQLRFSEGEGLAGIVFWLLGTVAAAAWSDLGIPAAIVVGCTGWLMVQARPLNAMLAGDESATALGVDVGRFRMKLLIVASLLTGTVVAVAGGVGFVGLMIPHVVRMLVGPDHRRVLPVAVLLGGIFLELVDVLARTAASPLELPLSVVTAAIGAPFFLWLMRRSERATGGR